MADVTIIVPCYNEEKNLPVLFSAIEKLNINKNKYEVIIADNGSSDRSIEIAKNNNAIVCIDKEAKIAGLRNKGVKYATGTVYAFIDSDCAPLPEWLDIIGIYLKDDSVGAFGSIPLYPSDGTWVEKAWFSITSIGIAETNFISSMNMIVKKEVFDEIGGFNEDLSTGEDYDLCVRLRKAGYRILHDSRITVIHYGYPKTLLERYKREIWYGEEMYRILKDVFFYMPFWISLFFGLIFIISFMSIILNISLVFFAFGLFIFVSLPIICAYVKAKKTKNYKYFFQLVAIYTVYLAGRFTAILIATKRFITLKTIAWFE